MSPWLPAVATVPMVTTDWLALLHPVLMILFVYPVVGATIRLGTLARERRLQINPLPPTVGVEHADHGRWVTSGAVVTVLIALLWSFLHPPAGSIPPAGSAALPVLLEALGGGVVLVGCLALWRVQAPWMRAGSALVSWAALLALGSRPEVRRLADDPLSGEFWRSHYWGGVLLCGLLLFAMAAAPEIRLALPMRRLHGAAAFLVALLLAVQAITGTRDLLAMAVAP